MTVFCWLAGKLHFIQLLIVFAHIEAQSKSQPVQGSPVSDKSTVIHTLLH